MSKVPAYIEKMPRGTEREIAIENWRADVHEGRFAIGIACLVGAVILWPFVSGLALALAQHALAFCGGMAVMYCLMQAKKVRYHKRELKRLSKSQGPQNPAPRRVLPAQ